MPRKNLTLLLLVACTAMVCRARVGPSPHPRFVAEAYARIDQDALEPPSRQELLDGAMRGMVGVLHRRGDLHSQYIPPRNAQPFLDEMRQEFGGIGVRIRMTGDPPRLLLVGMPEPDSPAAHAGVLPNDQVLQIDGEDVAEMKLEEIVERMRGRRGDVLTLTVLHAGSESPVELRMERDVINVPSVIGDTRHEDGSWSYRLAVDPRIGYVRIINFGNKTVDELDAVLRRLLDQGVQALVLDVRDNAGGALDAAIGVCDLFLKEGAPIVEIRGRRGAVKASYQATDYGPQQQPPMVVLVNENSASASEIVAAALKDDGRAAVAGERSFGKGTVQEVVPVEAGASFLKLTTSTYWRPSGSDIHRRTEATEADPWGVRPDAELALPLDKPDRETWRQWRALRDLTVFDSQTGEVASRPAIEEPTEIPADYEDRVLLRAVEHLQSRLDPGA